MKGLTRHGRVRAILLALALLSQAAFANAQPQQKQQPAPQQQRRPADLSTSCETARGT